MNPLLQIGLSKLFNPIKNLFSKQPAVPTTLNTNKPAPTPITGLTFNTQAPKVPTLSQGPKNTGLTNFSGAPAPRPNTVVQPYGSAPAKPEVKNTQPPLVSGPTPTLPSYSTRDGQNINPYTGGISEYPVPQQDYNRYTPPPIEPYINPYQDEVTNAENAYKTAGAMTQEEMDTQAELDRMHESFKAGFQNTEDKAIPMSFITGQQQSLEKRALNLAEPLADKLARLQAKRTSSLETSKFALDRADAKFKAEEDRNKPITLGSGESVGQYDRKTGTFKSAFTSPKADNTPASIQEYEYAKSQNGYTGTYEQFKNNVQVAGQQSAYQAERATRTINSVDELLPQVNKWTTGVGSFLAKVPGTDAKYFRSQVDTLVANITYGELIAMREASKTGGALGQVSDNEGRLLGAALGALSDRAITPQQYKIQLQKVKDSIQRWQSALSGGNGGGGTVQTTMGPINTNW